MFNVALKFENGTYEEIVIKSNALPNVIKLLTESQWVKCTETGRYYNLSKVVYFKIK